VWSLWTTKKLEDKKENRKQLKHCEGYNIFGFPQGERYPRYPVIFRELNMPRTETEKQLYEYKRGNGSKTARTHKCQPGMINWRLTGMRECQRERTRDGIKLADRTGLGDGDLHWAKRGYTLCTNYGAKCWFKANIQKFYYRMCLKIFIFHVHYL